MAEEHMAKRARTDKPLGRRPTADYRTRVIVKFRDHIQLPYDRTAQSRIEPLGIGPWDRLAAEFKGITLTPLFTSKQPKDIHALVDRAMATDLTYRPTNFLTYFALSIPVGVDAEAVVKVLSGWASVAIVYVEPPPVEPPVVNPADDPRSANQGYLDAAPDGVDAEYEPGRRRSAPGASRPGMGLDVQP
jgi:hypothetical protein